MPKISIIVPIYNAEKYLRRCVDSILAQTFKDFEVLLIDDGSTDNSFSICEEYVKKDGHVRIFHNQNSGVSVTRQFGIDNSCGEYTIHIDSDDWVEPDMLESLYNRAQETNADMVICDYFKTFSDNEVYVEQKPKSLNQKEIIRQLLTGSLHGGTWNKLIRRSCYLDNNINFSPNIIFCEDLLVMISLLNSNISVYYLHKAYYHYDQYSNNHSLARSNYLERYLSRIKVVKAIESIIKVDDYKKELFHLKTTIKDDVFFCKLFDKDTFPHLFPEINNAYVNSFKFPKTKSIMKNCICLALKGHYNMAQTIFSFYLRLRGIKR